MRAESTYQTDVAAIALPRHSLSAALPGIQWRPDEAGVVRPVSPRVLLAVGDPSLRLSASASLRCRGFSVAATTGEDAALTLTKSFAPDISMVDLHLLDPDGGMLFNSIRKLTDGYVVGITNTASEEARICALRSGADDAVSAPVNPDELVARCEALLRRPRELRAGWGPLYATVMHLGPLSVDVGRKEIRMYGIEVSATRIEFSLFEQLCRRPSEVSTRTRLLEEVWGPHWVGDTHVVDVHLSNLRRKLHDIEPHLHVIHTVRSIGFRLSSDLVNAPIHRRDQSQSA
ncbi:MAG: response regulator transcription factor [Ilumatobacteraceae bacterium]